MKRIIIALCAPVLLLAGCNGLGAGVRLPPPGAEDHPIASERDFLVGQDPEAEGYGLYSYLLLGSAPTPAERPRDLAAIAAYLNYIPRRVDADRYAQPSQLNITYLCVTTQPPATVIDVKEGDLSASNDLSAVEWLLDHYDYNRARNVLRALHGPHSDGPYIVSARQPLTGAAGTSAGYVRQDLSHAPPEFAASWVKIFLSESEQMPGTPGGLQEAALKLRETVALAADSLPQIQAALKKWITWVG
jgi:hypothetical protein